MTGVREPSPPIDPSSSSVPSASAHEDALPLGPRWESWPQAFRLLVTGRTIRPALPVALVVGSLLSVINQGAAVLGGKVDVVTMIRLGANYTIPYVVSSLGFLSAHRASRKGRGP